MTQYVARQEVDKRADDFGTPVDPSAGDIAWLLWGGDEGREWAEDFGAQMDEADFSQ